ncbi:MAG: transcriptional repressor [Verrucomicrobiota bacterium]|nr:transcriptional repressor [Verrucomicrobiota bacterium]
MQCDREKPGGDLTNRLTTGGFRFTPQRQHVYDVLLRKRDHPTADEVFIRAKRTMADISMATVYNCLDALVQCGLVRQVTLDRGATRFCLNMREHGHFYCDECGTITDVDLPAKAPAAVPLPRGFLARRFEIAIHGVCPDCAKRKKRRFAAATN